MISNVKKLSSFDRVFIESNERVQFVLDYDDPKIIPKTVEELIDSILAFKICIDGDNLVFHKNKKPYIHKIPSFIKNVHDAANFIDKQIPLDYNKEMASIAIDDHRIAISASHMLCDGGLFVTIFKRLMSGVPLPHEAHTVFPHKVEEIFAKELANADEFKVKLHSDSVNSLATANWSYKPINDQEMYCRDVTYETEAKDLRFTKDKFGLTDSLWTSLALAYCAQSKKFGPFGVSTCVDLRQKMNPSDITTNICNNFTSLFVIPRTLNQRRSLEQSTIRDLAKSMREDLTTKMNDGSVFATVKAVLNGFPAPETPTGYAEVSHIGRFVMKPPCVDMWVQQTMKSWPIEGIIPLSVFSKTSDKMNTVVTRLQYSPTVTSDKDGHSLMHKIIHAMRNIPADTKLIDAYHELCKID